LEVVQNGLKKVSFQELPQTSSRSDLKNKKPSQKEFTTSLTTQQKYFDPSIDPKLLRIKEKNN
jgi:hypothetical protein